MSNIQEPGRPLEIGNMNWVTCLPPGGGRRYNSCLVIDEWFSKTQIFLPCHRDDTARDPKFTLALWTNLHQLFGTKLTFSTAYHSQTFSLAEKMIHTLEDMVRIFCAYSFDLKDCDGFTHYWFTLLPELELAYKKSIHASTNQTPSIREEG
ncbi:hypothetical protein O181_103128 [Austropuccinia psidii MF-1]|uniref:Integrase catalytic domain-containing protein n=1 Tax=Austropuccinia psidii MF-1 TaxID=1389203 RepID=A0A9Q3JJS0_9BASI|nr:hypothetical protein [Austropuccinia psidii MF-1]